MRKLKTNWLLEDSLRRAGLYGVVPEHEKDLVKDLREIANLDVYSVEYLKNTNEPYPEAIQILLKHLYLIKDEGSLDALARSLTVKEAKGVAFEPIYNLYKSYRPQNEYLAMSGMANALQYLAEKKDLQKIIDLALDKKNGLSRSYFIDKIASSATKENVEEIKKVLETLSNDQNEGVRYRANKALQRKKFKI